MRNALRMATPAVADEIPVGAWLRQQREARGLDRREMARRLIQAARGVGDSSVPGIESMCQYIRRWEGGVVGLTERYRLCYCEAFGITAAEFGRELPDAGHIATVNAHGLSVSLQYVSGRLVIDISGAETGPPGPEPGLGHGLELVPSVGPSRSYGGRA